MYSLFLWILMLIQRGNKIIKDQQLINDQINLPNIRLVGENGEQLGLMSSNEANRLADEQSLDLVLISPNANPPVCKLMNYGKFKFEQAKKLKEQKKAQKVTEIKELQLSMTIEKHDVEVRVKQAKKFLADDNKVKVIVKMKGRQQARPETGVAVLNSFYEQLCDAGVVEKPAEIMGKNIIMILAPKK